MAENKINSAAIIVPQIYFDYIARLIPGFILLLSSYYLLFNDIAQILNLTQSSINYFKSQSGGQLLIIIYVFLVSYVISLICEAIYRLIKLLFGSILDRKYKKQIEITKEKASEFIENEIKKELKKDCKFIKEIFPDIFIMYDFIRINEPSIGSRLVKLRAEYYMFRTLAIGYTVFLLIKLSSWSFPLYFSDFLNFLLLILLIFSFVLLFFHRRASFLYGVHNNWILLNKENLIKNAQFYLEL